ncbi:MAG TPA: carboxypeptidase-like regulatory domain-containing protein [Bryobacteraceae bacterium]|nr:carboxypeptidase-like regulatory domain-containing protein [Bryobacteraceae bacterium]
MATSLSAQSIYSTLTGVVSDPAGAVVPNAKVTLKNEQSGSLRDTVTNAEGYFTFASVSVGNFTYELSVEAKGFSTYKATGIALNESEKRNINAVLQVGTTTETVEVTDTSTSIVPVDSGEKSDTLSTKELQNFVQVGSNAASFIGIMPGFGIQNGTSNHANFNGGTIGINANGDAGSQSPLNNAYSYNGLPANSLDITADGAHTSDPGCNCDTPVNPNLDMIAELKVLTSNFSAENQKGPAVVSSVAKSGGQQFHGSGFFYARNYELNANDALFNASGQGRTQNKYYYPGGTIGGPVLIPGTRFNKSRNKLFFFTGFEYFYQVLDTGLLRATVPTPGMLTGNFSPSEIAKEGNITAAGAPPSQLNAAALAKYPGGIIPNSQLDPNMVALMKLYPAANADPNVTGGYNYVQAENFNQNNTQWMSRVDYSISDNTKLFVRYNLQRETQLFPVGLWWRNGGQVPYPTPVEGKNRSDSETASLTHVFSPTMTNEVVFAYTFIGFPNVFEDPTKVDRSKVGYNYKGIFKNGVAQIPSFGQFGGEAALVFNPGGFEAGGPSAGLYANKYMPSVSDTLTKVWGTHTIKAGFYWEYIRNAQPANNNTNGELQVSASAAISLGNPYADLATGTLSGGYNESSFNRINDIAYNTYEGFVQDSWKVRKNLTLEFGVRLSHFQPWADRLGFGYSIFDYSQYKSTCLPTDYCGFEWHARDSSVPLAGFPTRAMFYQPRFGLAWDVFGEGKTVIRGGWGRFYFHAGQFTNGLDVSAGVKTINPPTTSPTGVPLMASQLDTGNYSLSALSPAAVDSKDDKQPYTDSYSFTISQRTPWSGLLEVSYVGNSTSDIPNAGNGGSIGANSDNINLVPIGAMLSSKNGGADPNLLVADSFRPLLGFSDLNLTTNNLYSNYNSLQVTWARTRGRYTVNLNYTYGKAMGILGAFDQFNVANNYAVLAANRTHIFNAAYSVELGTFTHGKVAGGFVNGWQLSGITQVQSGANLAANSGENFGFNLNGYKIPGTQFNVSNVSILGTPDIQLSPILTCNPTSNLGPHQYINPSCFAIPTTPGTNGPTTLPAIYGPAFFNSNLALFKNFPIKEQMKLEFRFEGYNFLNHPLWSFNGNNLSLGFDGTTGKLNTPNFGTVTTKQGNRVVQLSVKFYF